MKRATPEERKKKMSVKNDDNAGLKLTKKASM